MKKLLGALTALPLVLASTSFADDIFSAGDAVLKNIPKDKTLLVEKLNPDNNDRRVYNASVIAGELEKLNLKVDPKSKEAAVRGLLEVHAKDIETADNEIVMPKEALDVAQLDKNKPTTAWRYCSYRPWSWGYDYYYTYYPRYYSWVTYTYTVVTYYTYSYYDYGYTFYRPRWYY